MSPKCKEYLKKHLPSPLTHPYLAEVGSMDVVGGNVRSFIQGRGFIYTGIDIAEGPNVDIVVPDNSKWDLGKDFDVIISLNTFEHVYQPWTLLRTMARHLRKDGVMIIVAPFSFPLHRHPVDTFRYAPDGMKGLADYAGLKLKRSYLDFEHTALRCTVGDFCWLMLRKKFKEAFAQIPRHFSRPCYWHCIAIMHHN